MKKLRILIALIFVAYTIQQTTYYQHNGENNNPKNPKWGSTGSTLLRNTILTYDDNIGSPFGGNPSRLNSTRAISNLLFGREASGMRKTSKNFTDLLTYWGQIVDHDLSLSLDSSAIGACESFRIPIPAGDYFYDKSGTGNVTMGFCRTLYVNGTGTDQINIRQLPNAINSWLDASVVYGSDDVRAIALRTLKGGLMKTSDGPDGPLLPLNDNGDGSVLVNMDNNSGRVASTLLFAAGEQRANENSILTCLQTLMIREHNRRANLLPSEWSDEQKYQEARRWVTAHFQAITFNEFLTTLLATELPPYQYDPSLDPQITLFFSTVAFRYGHDEISGILKRYEKNGAPYKDGHILLRDAYAFPDSVKLVGIAPYLRGAAISEQSLADSMLEEDLRTFLFSQSSSFATDLAARNMQRARDHGIGMYNDCRKAYKLSTCDTFECVNNDPKIIELLNQAYGKDNVTYLDPFLGGLLEQKVPGSNLGLLFHTAIQEQFIRTRNADRFWYQNEGMFTKEELNEIENTKLAVLFNRNMDMEKMPSDLFVISDTPFITSLGTCFYDKTKWIVPIIVLGSLSAALIIVVHVLSFIIFRNKERANSSNDSK